MKRKHRDTVQEMKGQDNKSDHLSVYRYDGPEGQDDDVNSMEDTQDFRNRQVSYYVNKDAMRDMDNDADDDDEYGAEYKKKKSGYGGNLAN